MKNIDQYRGCLLAGAAGDALGYAVEFEDERSIIRHYGESGITEYDLKGGKARISDDTQMTLFTAEGLLRAGDPVVNTAAAYSDWYRTQTEPYAPKAGDSWLMQVPELWNRRAPGGTCMNAIRNFSDRADSIEEPVNNSKGCGAVMRAAPVGLMYTGDEAIRIGAETGALTHCHPLGYLPAGLLAGIVDRIVHEGCALKDAVRKSMADVERLYGKGGYMPTLKKLIDRAIELSETDIRDLDAVHALGEGWVGEEAVAIAVYCALRHPDDLEAALIAAVNHDGDSDSTGAIAGNILGAHLGLAGIPEKYLTDLEIADVIGDTADRLFNA